MMVEDHPLDYRTFEGIIPEGNCGAGTVIVWDEGTYSPRETADRGEGERLLREGLRKGHLRIVMNGQKRKGEFSLLKLKRGEDNAWLLVKGRDEWASDADVTVQNRSVASGRTLEDIAAERKGVRAWKSNRPANKVAPRRKNEPTLLYLANLGGIEINPWNSRVESQDNPDYLIIDLDPEGVSYDRVIEAAIAVRKLLEKAGAECYCKTSGKRGLHIFVPLGVKYDYDQARQFAEIIANLVNAQLPDSTSVVRSPAKRQGRVYLDFLQNRRGQTLAAPYSARPYFGSTVSTPLKWSEVRKGLDPSTITIRTMPKRLEKVGDLWKPVLGRGIDSEECLRRLK
jgi:DNA ligase D-like protein (predicted polymerase)